MLLSGIVMLAMFNVTLVSPILPELVSDDDEPSALLIGAFTSAEMVAYVVFAPVWGALSDRWRARRTSLLVGLAASAPLFAVMPHVPSFAALLGIRFVQGMFTVAAWSLAMTMVLDLADPGQRGRAMGVLGAGMMMGMAMGAPVGGLVADRFGVAGPFRLAALVFAVALLVGLMLLREPDRERRSETPRGGSGHAIELLGRLWMPSAYSLIDRFTAGFFITLFPAMLLENFSFSPGLRGMYLGLFFLPFALFQYPFGRLCDRVGEVALLLSGSVFYGAIMTMVAYLTPGPMAVGMFLLGICAAAVLPASLALVGRRSGAEERGLSMGVFNAMGSLGLALGLVASGALADAVGFPWAFVVGGASALGVVAATAVPLLRLHRHRA